MSDPHFPLPILKKKYDMSDWSVTIGEQADFSASLDGDITSSSVKKWKSSSDWGKC